MGTYLIPMQHMKSSLQIFAKFTAKTWKC